MSKVNWTIQLERDTAANWTTNNDVLLDGQIGLESNAGIYTKLKVGDGVTAWNSLSYFSASAEALTTILAIGNTTSGKNIIISNGDYITGANGALRLDFSNSLLKVTSDAGVGNAFYMNTDPTNTEFSNYNASAIVAMVSGASLYVQLDSSTGQLNIEAGTGGHLYFNSSNSYLYHSKKITLDAPSVNYPNLTANRIPFIDVNKNLQTTNVPLATFAYTSGLTSDAQTQIDARQLTISQNTAFNKNFGTTTGTIVEIGATLHASEVVFTGPMSKLTSSGITYQMLAYTSGVTSDIQTQINSKQATIVQNSAFNKDFGNTIQKIPFIAGTLGSRRAVITDTNGFLVTSGVTDINISYTSGLTSNALQATSNLSDLNSASIARANIGAPFAFQAGFTTGQSPADATTYYFGIATGTAVGTTSNLKTKSLPFACTLIGAVISSFNNTSTASSESSTIAVYKNNTTVVSTLSSAVKFNGAPSVIFQINVTGISVSFAAGDTIEIQWVTPTWVTNPTGAGLEVILYFTRD